MKTKRKTQKAKRATVAELSGARVSHLSPEHQADIERLNARTPEAPFGLCWTCEQPLLQDRGFSGTDLCGPCCTGESATLGLVTVECPKHGYDEREAGSECCRHMRVTGEQERETAILPALE